MAAVASVGRLSTYSQFEQLFSSIGTILTTLCDRTETAFQRAHVMKRDAQGNIKLYDSKDPATGEVRKVGVLTYIEDVKSGELFLDEPAYIVSVKCALIALGMPFYTLGKMSWHIFKTPFEIGAIALETLYKTGEQLALGKLYEGAVSMRSGITQAAEAFGTGLYEIVKAPFFGLGCELAALYGVVKPFHGRKIEAMIEKAWQNGASYKEDFRNVPARPGETCWQAFRKDMQDAHPFYLAHCFQVRGNVHDPRITVIRRDQL
ncbi:MAG: hypothetical protein JSS60_04720 [Verrucomicrobia bacterium]|nr:hypothetical protein [Verrucomicrobiota bacterium]